MTRHRQLGRSVAVMTAVAAAAIAHAALTGLPCRQPGSLAVADGSLSECYTATISPPSGGYQPSITLCRPV
jgi:hypothetical protein